MLLRVSNETKKFQQVVHYTKWTVFFQADERNVIVKKAKELFLEDILQNKQKAGGVKLAALGIKIGSLPLGLQQVHFVLGSKFLNTVQF